MATHVLTLFSLCFFWFPLTIAYYEDDCTAYVRGIGLVLAIGYANHGIDNFYYFHTRKPKRPKLIVYLASIADRTISVATAVFFAIHSFSVSKYWLASAITIVLAGAIYLILTPGENGHLWHMLVHFFAAIGMQLSVYACADNPFCAYCGEPQVLSLQKPSIVI